MAVQTQTVKFTNWTDEDFSWKWDGRDYFFPKGQSIYLEKGLADHFAKHLTDRELEKRHLQIGNYDKKSQDRIKFEALCFSEAPATVSTDVKTELANLNANKAAEKKAEEAERETVVPEAIKETKKRGRKPKVEDSFEGK